ncbi:MAG: HAD family hydrolase [Promethearchaeota archaeon]
MPIRWLILDAYAVIFKRGKNLNKLLIPFLREKGNNLEDNYIRELYREASLGKITSYELWHLLGYSEQFPDIEHEYLDKYIAIDEEFIELAPKFINRYSLALLTNDIAEWAKYPHSKYRLNEIFKEIIISGEVGIRKPDKRIFELLLKRLQFPSESCVFVDDKFANLQAASNLGINVIRFIRESEKAPFCSEFEVKNFHELLNVLENFF